MGVAVLGPKSTDFDETIASIPELAGRLSGCLSGIAAKWSGLISSANYWTHQGSHPIGW